jgi:hypothetical protein
MAAALSDFERAVNSFKKNADLNEAELAAFQLTDLQSLRQEINRIQTKQEKSKKLMYMRRLEPFLKTMDGYGKVLEVFLNSSDFIAFVWVRYLVRLSYCNNL